MRFADRTDAGRRLAEHLTGYRDQNVVVVGLPRGGVPVAYEVAEALGAPLDVLVVRKLGVPFQPELAFGAIGEGGVRVTNDTVVRHARLTDADIAAVEQAQRAELQRRVERYRRGHDRIPLAGRVVLIVDDGFATGATARAACHVARAQGAEKVVLAAPVGAPDTVAELSADADEVVCVSQPDYYVAVGQAYHHFGQTSDDEVCALLDKARGVDAPPICDDEVRVSAGPVTLAGHLTIPENPTGIVVFAHGSGSSRHSPRNRYVADVLNRAGLATLLFDLLTPEEELDRANVFDIELLAGRLVDVTAWLRRRGDTAALPIGYFGASTGAGAALRAAAESPADVAAVVSRGGRPDLAGAWLTKVAAPTLLIVGGRDHQVLELNRQAQAVIGSSCELAVVPGATHLFEEPGTLQQAAQLARDWFVTHLTGRG